MKYILASKGFVIIVDDEDYDRLSKFSWYAHSHGGSAKKKAEYRPARRDPKPPRKVHPLVQAIVGRAPAGMVIDHINGNPWDNRRENLRLCTNTQNIRNQRRPRKENGAGKGAHFINGRWTALICAGNGNVRLGSFESAREAELAYDAAALFLHGEFACLNHPTAGTLPRSPAQIVADCKERRRAPAYAALRLVEGGSTALAAARKCGVSVSTVCKYAKRAGLSLTAGRPRLAA